MKMNLTDTAHDSLPPLYMMGDFMIPDERILKALHKSGLVEDLRDFEINLLAELISVRFLEANKHAEEPYGKLLAEALMILVEGEMEIRALVNSEPVLLNLQAPGDMARVISFVGGKAMNVSAQIKVRKDSAVLLLQRAKLESLLASHPSIVYCVMRNLVRQVHGVARRKNAEMEEMSNYIFRTHGLY